MQGVSNFMFPKGNSGRVVRALKCSTTVVCDLLMSTITGTCDSRHRRIVEREAECKRSMLQSNDIYSNLLHPAVELITEIASRSRPSPSYLSFLPHQI